VGTAAGVAKEKAKEAQEKAREKREAAKDAKRVQEQAPATAPPTPAAEPAKAVEPAPYRASWELPDQPTVAPASTATAGGGTEAPQSASWELSQPTSAAIAAGDAREDEYLDDEEMPKEGLVQNLLSYAGLAAAVVVVILGIALMVSSRG
jgi:hypothetical protein